MFNDQPDLSFIDPVIVIATLAALAAVAVGFWQRQHMRRRPPRGPAYQVFRLDAATALLGWGVAQVAFGAGWVLRIEGLRMPIWSYLGLLVGIAIGVFLWRRERRNWPALAKTAGVEQLPDGSIQRGESRTWELGVMLALGAGLVAYVASAGHRYGHPIHWLTTALLLVDGYALGVAVWSPRFKLITVRAKRHPAPSDTLARRSVRLARRPKGGKQ